MVANMNTSPVRLAVSGNKYLVIAVIGWNWYLQAAINIAVREITFPENNSLRYARCLQSS